MARPKWMDAPAPTRARSNKQERKVAKTHDGFTTINSGATFTQNDVETKELSIECKTTAKKSYALKVSELDDVRRKTPVTKIPVFQIDFEEHEKSYITLAEHDFLALMEELNTYRNG